MVTIGLMVLVLGATCFWVAIRRGDPPLPVRYSFLIIAVHCFLMPASSSWATAIYHSVHFFRDSPTAGLSLQSKVI